MMSYQERKIIPLSFGSFVSANCKCCLRPLNISMRGIIIACFSNWDLQTSSGIQKNVLFRERWTMLGKIVMRLFCKFWLFWVRPWLTQPVWLVHRGIFFYFCSMIIPGGHFCLVHWVSLLNVNRWLRKLGVSACVSCIRWEAWRGLSVRVYTCVYVCVHLVSAFQMVITLY